MNIPTRYQIELDRARLGNVRSLIPVLLAAHMAFALLELGLSAAGFDIPLLRNNLIRLSLVPLLAWVWIRAGHPRGLPPAILVWATLLGFAAGHGVIAANLDMRLGFPLFAGSGWLVVTASGFFPARGRDGLGLGLAVASAFLLAFLMTAHTWSVGTLFLLPLALVLMIAPLLSGYAAFCLDQNLRTAWRADAPDPESFPVTDDTPDQVVSLITDLLEESGNDSPDSTQVSRRDQPADEASWSPELKRPVLVVENGLAQQKLTSRLLGRLGFESHVVGSGPDAVEAVLAQRFALVLMDGPMPGMDGYEAVRLIRAVGTDNCGVPIVGMLTESEAQENAQRALESGMDAWVQKPLSLQTLKATLSRWGSGRSTYVER